MGEGLVRAFLAEGATVIVSSRSGKKVSALQASLTDYDTLIPKTADIGTANGAALLRDWIADEVGRLDTAVASRGGWWQGRPLTNVSLDTWHEVLDMGLTTHFNVAKTYIPVLASRPGASYTFINGPAGLNLVPGAGPLSVSSAGQFMLKDVMAVENDTVRINTLVLATPVRNRSRPDGEDNWLTADDAGAYAVYLASDPAKDMNGKTIVFESREQVPKADA